ncbi:MAG: CDP-alcohol phosphatidyltransferase family protein [Burkholderiales bacterium]|nr:CDP-alcohol phosphatidyltransferase family protein [Anaerolineae bacterium]
MTTNTNTNKSSAAGAARKTVTAPITLTDRLRAGTKTFTDGLGLWLHRSGVHPDAITIFGTLLVGVAGIFIGAGQMGWAAVVLFIAFPLDALDGATARARWAALGQTTKFGGVLDSALDRYADGFIFGGLSYYFAVQNQLVVMLLALAALIGTFGVSYVRARAGEADLSVKIGAFSRMERIVALMVGLIVPVLLVPMLIVLAVGTNFTTFQRLWYTYKNIDREAS